MPHLGVDCKYMRWTYTMYFFLIYFFLSISQICPFRPHIYHLEALLFVTSGAFKLFVFVLYDAFSVYNFFFMTTNT